MDKAYRNEKLKKLFCFTPPQLEIFNNEKTIATETTEWLLSLFSICSVAV